MLARTEAAATGEQVYDEYVTGYQQEFLFRDAKQELGLTHGQAYTADKIHFHVNTALTVGSLAKAAHQLLDEKRRDQPFSIADVKTQYVNEYQGARIIGMFGSQVNERLIAQVWDRVRDFGLRRA